MGQAKQRGSFEQRKQAAEDAEALRRLENNGRMPQQYKSKTVTKGTAVGKTVAVFLEEMLKGKVL